MGGRVEEGRKIMTRGKRGNKKGEKLGKSKERRKRTEKKERKEKRNREGLLKGKAKKGEHRPPYNKMK